MRRRRPGIAVTAQMVGPAGVNADQHNMANRKCGRTLLQNKPNTHTHQEDDGHDQQRTLFGLVQGPALSEKTPRLPRLTTPDATGDSVLAVFFDDCDATATATINDCRTLGRSPTYSNVFQKRIAVRGFQSLCFRVQTDCSSNSRGNVTTKLGKTGCFSESADNVLDRAEFDVWDFISGRSLSGVVIACLPSVWLYAVAADFEAYCIRATIPRKRQKAALGKPRRCNVPEARFHASHSKWNAEWQLAGG